MLVLNMGFLWTEKLKPGSGVSKGSAAAGIEGVLTELPNPGNGIVLTGRSSGIGNKVSMQISGILILGIPSISGSAKERETLTFGMPSIKGS